MMWRTFMICTFAVAAVAQQPTAPVKEKPGSVTVTVFSEMTGAPVPNAEVNYTGTSGNTRFTFGRTTDAAGRATIQDVRPGRYTLTVSASAGSARATKAGELAPEQNLSLQVRVLTDGQISGRVLDRNGEALPNIAVYLVTREYSLGSLRYPYATMTSTNDRGDYLIEHVHPGVSYLLLAVEPRGRVEAVSRAPADAALRRPVTVPTYYPGVASLNGAEVLKLGDNERRENVDIRMARLPNYCLEAELPALARFELREQWPFSRYRLDRPAVGAGVPVGVAGPDGKIRVCDLHSGDYELAAYPAPASGDLPDSFTRTMVTVANRDVPPLAVIPVPRVSMQGEVVWDGAAPPTPVRTKLQFTVDPQARRFGLVRAASDIPGSFSLDLLMDDYSLEVSALPAGTYLKELSYGGSSILGAPFRPGTAAGAGGIRVVLAQDGATIAVKVVDKEGNPAPDHRVVVLPAAVNSEAELSMKIESGLANASGTWTSPVLAPGRYYVLATSSTVDKSPENLARLWRARDRASDIVVAPKTSPQVTLSPLALE